jgi:hypothetical protein
MARAAGADGLAVAGQIMSILRRSPEFRESVVAHDSGERPIMVAAIDDRLEEVVDRIRAVGLPLTLCVPGGSASITVMTVRAGGTAEQAAAWTPAPADATLGMIVSRFWTDSTAKFRLAGSELALELA